MKPLIISLKSCIQFLFHQQIVLPVILLIVIPAQQAIISYLDIQEKLNIRTYLLH